MRHGRRRTTIVRVGGRCQNLALEPYTMHKHLEFYAKSKAERQQLWEVYQQIEHLQRAMKVCVCSASIQLGSRVPPS